PQDGGARPASSPVALWERESIRGRDPVIGCWLASFSTRVPASERCGHITRSSLMSCVLRLLVLMLVLGSSRLAFGQDVTLRRGVARTLKSAILSEDRKVIVHLPTNYDTSGTSYPVLYLLDGTEAFLLEMTAITTRLRNDRNAPEMIIVAIENTNRDSDMMPV